MSKTIETVQEIQSTHLTNQLQRFIASGISIITMLHDVTDVDNLTEKETNTRDKFVDTGKKIIENMKDDTVFDYTRFIKKAYRVLRTEEQCKQLREKNPELFNVRDAENKIVTILPGYDIKFGYKYLSKKDEVMFWQYMYLFSSSVFEMIKEGNSQIYDKYPHIIETVKHMEADIAKTGVMFNNRIFNPFLGVLDTNGKSETYTMDDMFSGELPKQHEVSIETVLNTMGVNKMFDPAKIREELDGLGEEQISDMTDRIANLLGASGNSDVKEVCDLLIRDITTNLKEGGIDNISDTLSKVAENAKQRISMAKMQKTASKMKNFMKNSEDQMKNMKDAEGNPIGEEMLKKLSIPMQMMNMFTGKNNANAQED